MIGTAPQKIEKVLKTFTKAIDSLERVAITSGKLADEAGAESAAKSVEASVHALDAERAVSIANKIRGLIEA